MDDKTTIAALKEKVKVFSEERDWDQFHNAKDLAIGVITEASELLEHFRFLSEKEVGDFFDDEKRKNAASEEIADILIFLFRLAQKYDIDLSDAFVKKLQKNEKRFPVETLKGKKPERRY